MYYTIYQITNKINGKIYIGKHQTKDLDDGYMGSGKYLKRAIEKYGKDNFDKKILFKFDNEKEMNKMEREMVTEEFCNRDDTYNICEGGHGGFGYLNRTGKNWKHNNRANNIGFAIKAQSEMYRTDENFKTKMSKIRSEYLKRYYSENISHWVGRTHKQESKDKVGRASSIHQSGEGNSQYGTMWITDGANNKKIRKNEPIPDGWQKGRKCKKLQKNSWTRH